MATRYRVYCTPLATRTTYGDEIEITDFVNLNGLKTIKRSIDSEDYDVGTFTYDDLEIKAQNVNGYFNEASDYRSIFKHTRDTAKIRVVYENDVTGEAIVYKGLINEEATKLDVSAETISFRVLSSDSVLRNTKISGGVISTGSSFSSAFVSIFSDTKIMSVLSLDPGDIDLPYDGVIDDGSWFDNKSAREALNSLLVASGAVILIDEDLNVSIRSRSENMDTDILNLYGPFDIHRRQNTHRLKDYNTGMHRMFTAVVINERTMTNDPYVMQFGYRSVDFDLAFITDEDQEEAIGNVILEEFKAPKIECVVEVPIRVARNTELLDRVSLDWPLRITPAGMFLPIIGHAQIGDSETPLPNTFGSLGISSLIAFKVIEIQEDPDKFVSFLKLRQVGDAIGDGYFTDDNVGIVGFAIIGLSMISGVGDAEDTWNPSVLGAALLGSTEVEV